MSSDFITFQIEVLSVSPEVYEFHDFVPEPMLDKVITMAAKELERSTVIVMNNPMVSNNFCLSAVHPTLTLIVVLQESTFNKDRTSLNAWLTRDEEASVISMTKSIEHVTGLNVRNPAAGEEYQIGSYMPSMHYREHVDPVRQCPCVHLNDALNFTLTVSRSSSGWK